VSKSKDPQTLATPRVYSDSEDLDHDNDQSNGHGLGDLDSPIDDEEPDVDMEVIGQKLTKALPGLGVKGKKKKVNVSLRDEIRASRKEMPKSEIGPRVWLMILLIMMCANCNVITNKGNVGRDQT